MPPLAGPPWEGLAGAEMGADGEQGVRRQDVPPPVNAASRRFPREDEEAPRPADCRAMARAPAPGAARRTGEFAGEFVVVEEFPEIWLLAQDAQGDGQVEAARFLGRSAGARLAVMRWREKVEAGIDEAARTRSRALDFGIGQADQGEAGRPLARWDSTVTGGAERPSRPRLWTTASAIRPGSGGRGRSGALQGVDPRFQILPAFAGAGQHLGLDVEFFPVTRSSLPNNPPSRPWRFSRSLAGPRRAGLRRAPRSSRVFQGRAWAHPP